MICARGRMARAQGVIAFSYLIRVDRTLKLLLSFGRGNVYVFLTIRKGGDHEWFT